MTELTDAQRQTVRQVISDVVARHFGLTLPDPLLDELVGVIDDAVTKGED